MPTKCHGWPWNAATRGLVIYRVPPIPRRSFRRQAIMVKTALTAAAVCLSLSTLALAQTSPGTPSSRPAAPPPGSSGSGSSSNPAALTPDQIKGALEERGYSNVQVQPSGTGHKVTAMKDGNQIRLNVDATGHVTSD
jgi:ABC-type phosphate transport system substrate-binding protein